MAKSKGNEDELQQAAELLRALSHPLRLKILEFIDKNNAVNVNKIHSSLKLEQSITSQHLRILRMADIVETKRDGKFIFYAINYERLEVVMQSIGKFVRNKD